MTFHAELETMGLIPVIRCQGSLVLGEDTQVLNDALESALAKSGACILHLGGVDRIDAHGIGVLVRLHTCAIGSGRSLNVHVSPKLSHVLAVTGVLGIVDFTNSDTLTNAYPPETVPSCPHSLHGERASCCC